MSRSDWFRWVPVLALQAAAILLLINVGVSTYSQYSNLRQEWVEQNDYERNQTRNAAEEIAKNCSVGNAPLINIQNCLSSQVDRYVEQQHRNQDLQAQQEMAYWAHVIVWLTAVGVIVSGAGLWLLFVSLRQTRKAIADTREIGEAQVRAYLSLDMSDGAIALEDFRADSAPRVKFRVKNSGNSPALKHRYAAGVVFADLDFPSHNGRSLDPVVEGREPSDVLPAGDSVLGKTTNVEAWTREMLESVLGARPKKILVLLGVIYYSDVFGKPRQTRFCLKMHVLSRPKGETALDGFSYTWSTTANHNDAT